MKLPHRYYWYYRTLCVVALLFHCYADAKCYLSSLSTVEEEPSCAHIFPTNSAAVPPPPQDSTGIFTTTGCDLHAKHISCRSSFDESSSLAVDFSQSSRLTGVLEGDLSRVDVHQVLIRVLLRSTQTDLMEEAGKLAAVLVNGELRVWNVTKMWAYSPVFAPATDHTFNITVLHRTDVRFDRVVIYDKGSASKEEKENAEDVETITAACVCAPLQHFIMVNALAIALPVGLVLPVASAFLYLIFVRKGRRGPQAPENAQRKVPRFNKAKVLSRRASYKKPTFRQILGDVNLRTKFRSYLTSHQAAENLLFVEEVEHFEKISQDHFRQKEGIKILQRFVLQDAPLQVNLSSDARNSTNLTKGFNPSSFQRAKKEIEVLLEQNYYNSFTESLEADHYYA